MYEEIEAALREAIEESKGPGGVLYVGNREQKYVHAAYGYRQLLPWKRRAHPNTLYDLASLTKVVSTATAIMMLRDEGALRLDQRAASIVPIPGLGDMTLFHLLTHTSGFVPFQQYHKTHASVESMVRQYAADGIAGPPGVNQRYSDAGFMLLALIAEAVSGQPLDVFSTQRIFEPLAMAHTAFNPPRSWSANCAATEKSAWRKRVILGEVHDDNAYAAGGVSGHAGLFSTAGDLALFCRGLLSGKLLRESTLVEMTTMGKVPGYPWRGLAWQMDPWGSKSIGFLPSRTVFGHTGWTGTSIWMDRETGLFAILLGNTCHPARKNRDNKTYRRVVHKAIARTFYPSTSNTHTGLDRLVREEFTALKNQRYALLTNHASTDQFGRPILDVLGLTRNGDLKRIFSPEHGIRGQAEAGETVASEAGAVPIVSLYGGQKAPTSEDLRGIDLFVVDLQDVGARYYTYHATMRKCIEACAKAGKPVLVLDRPNPLGGVVLEGPIAEVTTSPVSCAPIPIRHGMTMGELAAFYVHTELKNSPVRLRVNLLDNWPPQRLFDECSLPWTPPSPNIPTPETALLYVGMCLFEGVNLNEGRGTDTPFARIGAPWLDAEAIVHAIREDEAPGCTLEPVEYTPRSIPGKAASPRYIDEVCRGVHVTVTEPHELRSFTLAVALLSAIRSRHETEFEWREDGAFDTLAGGPDLRKRIQSGQSANAIVQTYAPELEAFDAKRPRFYAEDGINPDGVLTI